MQKKCRRDVSDGESWWCPRCKTQKSIRDGSFFSKSRITLQNWLLIMYWWARQFPVTDTAEDAQVEEKTAIDVYQWLREVCSTRLIRDGPAILGGAGVVVQVDESLFRHKPKVILQHILVELREVCIHSQNHRGRATSREIWVFGMVDTSHTPGLGYMEIVPRRDAATLLPIIQAHTAPNTIIHSDQWAAYNGISAVAPVTHQVVNHSLHFVDPTTGVHTQNMESYWNRVKGKLKRMRGYLAHQLPSYLDEFMWRERHGNSAGTAFHQIIQDIRDQYPV